MTSFLARRGALAALFAAAALLAACSKDKAHASSCSTDQDCIDHYGSERWFCDKHANPPVCAQAARDCNSSADCCPSQICNLSLRVCRDKYTSCPDPGTGTGAGSCPAAGEVCAKLGYEPAGFGCSFLPCGAGGACGDGTTCFNGFCVGEPPCGGGCQPVAGEQRVCVTETSYCSPAPANQPSCQVSCPSGQMLVLQDPTNIFDRCTMPTPCTCTSLPPLAVRDVARHSSLALSAQNVYVSAYDGQYGDLVVMTYDKANLAKPLKSEWLDGVPAAGHIGGDLAGPRHGITDPGANVGMYSSIATNATGDVFVAYYDVDNGDLKFVARYGGIDKAWTAPVTIDGSTATSPAAPTGDVGLYASIAVTSRGVPAVAYYRRGSYDASARAETGLHTGLVYAVATQAQPTMRAHWKVVGDVDAADRPAPPCSPHGQSALCAAARPPEGLRELPAGVGLMPALAFLNDLPVIAYHDSINHTLKAVMATGGNAAAPAWGAPVVLDGGDPAPAPKRDTGRFPAIAIGPANAGARIAISFQDVSSQQLLLYLANSLTPHAAHDGSTAGLIHVVDDGKPGAGEAFHPQTFPGAQSAVAYTPSGTIAVAYQDATPVDLILSVWNPAMSRVATHTTVRSQGAAGFWPRLAIDGSGNAFLSSASVRATTAALSGNQLFVESRSIP